MTSEAALSVSDVVSEPLTCFYRLPAQGEGAPGLQVVGGDGAVVVSRWTPGERGCALRDLLHNHYPWWAWGTCRQKRREKVKVKPC